MSDLEKYVQSKYSESDLLALSQLLAQLNKIGFVYSGNWLIRLLTHIELQPLYYWAVEFGTITPELIFTYPEDTKDFVEVLKLKQLSFGIEIGLINTNTFNYLLFFYQYLNRFQLYIIELGDVSKFQSILRLDTELRELCLYDLSLSSSQSVISSEEVSLNDLLKIHSDKRLPISGIIYYSTIAVPQIDSSLLKIPLTIYSIHPVPFDDNLVNNISIKSNISRS